MLKIKTKPRDDTQNLHNNDITDRNEDSSQDNMVDLSVHFTVIGTYRILKLLEIEPVIARITAYIDSTLMECVDSYETFLQSEAYSAIMNAVDNMEEHPEYRVWTGRSLVDPDIIAIASWGQSNKEETIKIEDETILIKYNLQAIVFGDAYKAES